MRPIALKLHSCIHVSLMSFPCVLVPPTEDIWRDVRKPNVERGNKENWQSVSANMFSSQVVRY